MWVANHQRSDTNIYVNHELCMWVTNYVCESQPIRDLTHELRNIQESRTYVIHELCMWVANYQRSDSLIVRDSHICSWLCMWVANHQRSDSSLMSGLHQWHTYVRHDSFVCETLLIRVWDMTHSSSISARPYESCKIFKGRPRRNAFSNLVHRQYKSFPPDRFLSGGNQEHNWVE